MVINLPLRRTPVGSGYYCDTVIGVSSSNGYSVGTPAGSSSAYTTYACTFTGDNLQLGEYAIYSKRTANSTTIFWNGSATIQWQKALWKKSNVSGVATSIVSIGNLAIIVIFGMNDKEFFNGFGDVLAVSETATEATTGEITLGNAVGYLEANYNGTVVKIPYYLE